ncbi:MAG: tRNA (N(6)-L-threonylcarbamoyladenosine(37)-C(2))-methylthiotransferase [Candidatus Micrarchaeota archaeon]|nr:tRNA (N(6)-L-threonylcarbamoyladenosine(37)-C(2))-methylthiotransferase [Candidatus Micrarchaeota archaeon]
MKVFVKTYGCTLNRADGETLSALVGQGGHAIVGKEEDADIIIVNTCTVKLPTENKILSYLRKLKESRRKFIISGCMTVDSSLLKKFNAPMLGPSSLRYVNRAIEDCLNNDAKYYGIVESKDFLPKIFSPPIARISIGEGCTDRCFFCQSRLARPKLISQSPKSIILQMENAIAKGCKEIQFSGCDTGAYGLDINTNLVELLKNAVEVEGDFMIRIGMANPHHIKRIAKDLAELYKNRKIYKFLHTSVQSGSNKVLREMARGHSIRDFEDIASFFRKNVKDIMIETDIIVGYPTETEKDFEETVDMLKRVKPDVVNLSKFTPRKGTEAAEMKQLASEITKQRSIKVSKLLKKIGLENSRKYIGRKLRVLITEEGKGRAENYKQVAINRKIKLGEWVNVKITDCTNTTLIGKVE